MSSKCPVCQTEVQGQTNAGPAGTWYEYSCRRCGEFRIDDLLSYELPRILQDDTQKRAVLSQWIRTRYESLREGRRKDPTVLTEELVDDIIKNSRPPLRDQADNLIRWIGDNVKIGGQFIDVDKDAIQALVGSATFEEFELVFRYVRDKGLIEHKSGGGNIWVKATLSFGGWERYQELKRATSNSRRAFMAMQYNAKSVEDIVDSVFRDAVRKTGFDLFMLRDRPVAGLIDNRLRAEIRAARFVIADLTDRNPGAYWEAGYAEGLGKPVIYACEKKTFEDPERKPHFDTNHHQTVLWDSGEPETTARELKATIRATLPAEAKLTDD